MKKKFRIKKNHEFQRIIRLKKFTSNDSFVLYSQPRKETRARVGISVPSKLGNAVVRNKIKRQCRMMVSQLLNFDEQLDFIIIVRAKYLTKDFASNVKSLQSLFDKQLRRSHE